jgi:hypothetical protein
MSFHTRGADLFQRTAYGGRGQSPAADSILLRLARFSGLPVILILNIGLAAAAFFLSNNFLTYGSFWLYGFQLFTLIPYILKHTRDAKDVFIPTTFALAYYLVSLTMGALLVPRGFGFREYSAAAVDGTHYRLVVPYLLLSNLIMFLLSMFAIVRLEDWKEPQPNRKATATMGRDVAHAAAFCSIFALVTISDVFDHLPLMSTFAAQAAIMVIHLSSMPLHRWAWKYAVYLFYIGTLVAYDFNNKREIGIAIFIILFFHCYRARIPLGFTPGRVVVYAGIAVLLILVILTASVSRGYGGFDSQSASDSLQLIPKYIESPLFLDGVTDNFEFSFFYGSDINAMQLTLDGYIRYQFGKTLIKPLFLPFPRDIFPIKPQSAMEVYTTVAWPGFWERDGSLPVPLPAELFMNFHYLGLFACALILYFCNEMFVKFHTLPISSFAWYSCAFLFLTFLLFARGSGMELWLFTFFAGCPILLVLPRFQKAFGMAETT